MSWSTANGIGFRNSGVHDSGDAEITEFADAGFCEEDVGVFEISVNDISIMQVFNCQAYLGEFS